MGSLVKLATKLEKKKQEVSKIKRKSLRELEKVKSIQRKSASGLKTIERHIESAKEQLSDVSGVLTQKLAQKESIERLIAAAQEKLTRENEAKEQAEQDYEFADSPEEKQSAEYRLKAIADRIDELKEEIKQRNKTARKISAEIDDFSSYK